MGRALRHACRSAAIVRTASASSGWWRVSPCHDDSSVCKTVTKVVRGRPLKRSVPSSLAKRRYISTANCGGVDDQYLATSQSAFCRGRSTSDVVWCHRWLCSMTQRFITSIHILGIDMSKAFNTVRRDVLMKILESFLQESELRMIRILLTETWLEP